MANLFLAPDEFLRLGNGTFFGIPTICNFGLFLF